MLIKCPECELQVSDKALSCPHCGYPIVNTSYRRPSKKRMRLPNGFGQITEIKGKNLRNPFRAMVTVGKTPEGRPIAKMLKPKAYFRTYNEAYEALAAYNKNPYNLDENITMKELFERWSEHYFPSLSNSAIYVTCWAYCSEIYNMQARDVRARHLKGCLENGINRLGKTPTPSIQKPMKAMFNLIFDYAIEYELIEHNYARDFSLSKEAMAVVNNPKHHMSFTDEEMEIIWAHTEKYKVARMILICCYMGWRPQELISLKVDDVNLDEDWIIGGMKTDAGKNRKVPIHKKIKELVKDAYSSAEERHDEYLFTNEGVPYTYGAYQKQFKKFIDYVNIDANHKAHDPRKHFVTMAKSAGVDEYAIKRVVGHAISDLTERVYTDRDFEWLRDEIEKIQ